MSREREALSKQLGRSPTVHEIARAIGCSSEQVLEATEAARSYEAASLDAPGSQGEEETGPLVDMIGGDDQGFGLVENREALTTTWRGLLPVEREVLRLRLTEDLTQREIGERVGYSQMHVSRLLRRALDRVEDATAAA